MNFNIPPLEDLFLILSRTPEKAVSNFVLTRVLDFSESQLYYLRKTGRLPWFKKNGKVYYWLEAVENLLHERYSDFPACWPLLYALFFWHYADVESFMNWAPTPMLELERLLFPSTTKH